MQDKGVLIGMLADKVHKRRQEKCLKLEIF